jgi:ribosomal protection tetracycline resistance protein
MQTERIINIGIVAHVDAGKTTLTEQMLFVAGAIRKAGNVDEGTTHTDFLELERARGITIRAATVVMEWNGTTVNLIDTPGHADFSAEVERSLRVLDLAVMVVSAVEGIQSQTEAIFGALRKLQIPTLIFINKVDRAGADPGAVISQFRDEFGVDAAYAESALISPVTELLEAVAQYDDIVLEQYLEGGSVELDYFKRAFSRLVTSLRIYPVLTGSAICAEGVRTLLDTITLIGESKPAPSSDSELSAVVFRVEHEKTMGRVAHVRLFGGSLQNRDTVHNATQDTDGKIVQIRKVMGDKSRDVGIVSAGDIAAICGLSNVCTGDILGSSGGIPSRVNMAQPLLSVSVIPSNEGEWPHIVEAFEELSAEEPLYNLFWEKSTRQMTISITGKIQLEILSSIVKSRFGLDVTYSQPKIIYRETPAGTGYGFDAYTMPKPCWAILKFHIEPLPEGSGIEYKSVISENKILYRYQSQIEQAMPNALRQGPLGWQVTDAKITLVDGSHHHIHTHPLDFVVATPMAIMRGLYDIGTTLLEPIQSCRISVSEELLGKLISQVIAMRGSFDTPMLRKGVYTLDAKIPAATSMDLPVWLASISSGKATLLTVFDSYQPCPLELGNTTPYKGISPIDRAKYIMHVRGAI